MRDDDGAARRKVDIHLEEVRAKRNGVVKRFDGVFQLLARAAAVGAVRHVQALCAPPVQPVRPAQQKYAHNHVNAEHRAHHDTRGR